MCGGANMVPRLYVDLFHAANTADVAGIRNLHEQVIRISDALYTVGNSGSSYFRGLKCALSVLGLCGDVLAEPYQPFGPVERETIRKRLRELGMIQT
jgi:dihydrodipicolinate synthase/N-acetylneuraminate lyase